MRTVIKAIITSTLILSVTNVALLLMRANSSTIPALQQTTITTSPAVRHYWQPRPELPTSASRLPWLRRWFGLGDDPMSSEALAALGDGLSQCPTSRRPSDVVWIQSIWQLQRVANERIYVYSAYFDDRPDAGRLPSLRVLALSTFRREVVITCSVWYDGVDAPYFVRATVNAEAGTGYAYDRQVYREYAYICPLSTFHPVPSAVSVYGGSSACPLSPAGYTTLVPVQRTAAAVNQPVEFGVCVTAGYGHLEPEVFVEWVELNRMFGVEEINLYDTWYNDSMAPVFDYYRDLGVLRVHALPHPRAEHPSWFFNKVRNLRIIALNDCQLKFMYRYRYIVVVDTDEIIVPRTATNYSQLMAQLDIQRNVPGVAGFTYVFLNIYFLLDFDPDTTKPYYLRTVRHRQRIRPKSWGYAPKSIVDPRHCSVLFNHYCTRYLIRPPSPKLRRTHRVPFSTASSHHYRRCGKFYAYTCDQLFAEKTPDDFMLTLEKPL